MQGGPFQLSFGVAFLNVFPFIELNFPLSDPEQDFHFPVLPVTFEGDDGIALDGSQPEEFSDFSFAEQQLPDGLGLMIFTISLRVLIDMSIMQKRLVVVNLGECVPDLPFAGPKRLDLRTAQHQASLEGFQDMVIAMCFRVCQNIRHKKISQKESLLAGLEDTAGLALLSFFGGRLCSLEF